MRTPWTASLLAALLLAALAAAGPVRAAESPLPRRVLMLYDSAHGRGAEDNLAFRAWKLLKTRFGIQGHLQIVIEKRIPFGAGLAGGSSDAAAVLRGANQLFGLGLSQADLSKLSLELGADLPFCIRGGLALAEGVGEQLTTLRPGAVWPLLLLNPGFAVATSRVYAAYDQLPQMGPPDLAGLRQALEAGDRSGILAAGGNALEAAACQLHPELAALRQALLDQGLRPLLSGSGGTFFLLLEDEAQGEALAKYWRQRLPWVTLTQTTT